MTLYSKCRSTRDLPEGFCDASPLEGASREDARQKTAYAEFQRRTERLELEGSTSTRSCADSTETCIGKACPVDSDEVIAETMSISWDRLSRNIASNFMSGSHRGSM